MVENYAPIQSVRQCRHCLPCLPSSSAFSAPKIERKQTENEPARAIRAWEPDTPSEHDFARGCPRSPFLGASGSLVCVRAV